MGLALRETPPNVQLCTIFVQPFERSLERLQDRFLKDLQKVLTDLVLKKSLLVQRGLAWGNALRGPFVPGGISEVESI